MLDTASRTGVLRLAERMIHHSHAHDSLARCELSAALPPLPQLKTLCPPSRADRNRAAPSSISARRLSSIRIAPRDSLRLS